MLRGLVDYESSDDEQTPSSNSTTSSNEIKQTTNETINQINQPSNETKQTIIKNKNDTDKSKTTSIDQIDSADTIETNTKIFSSLPSSKKKRKRDLKSILTALDINIESMLKESEKEVGDESENEEEKGFDDDDDEKKLSKDDTINTDDEDDEPESKKKKLELLGEESQFIQNFEKELNTGTVKTNEPQKNVEKGKELGSEKELEKKIGLGKELEKKLGLEKEENIDDYETDPKMYEEVEEEIVYEDEKIDYNKREFERSQMEIPEEVAREIKLSGAKFINISGSSALQDEELRRRALIERYKNDMIKVPKIDESLRPIGEPQKHHITYLAFQAQKRAAELLERGERAFITKRESWSKYGW